MIAIRASQILTPLATIEPGLLFTESGLIKDIVLDQKQDLSGMEVIGLNLRDSAVWYSGSLNAELG